MKKNHRKYHFLALSEFGWWIIGILMLFIIGIIVYLIIDISVKGDWKSHIAPTAVMPLAISLTAIYGFLSLYILLSEKSTYDNRFNSLPIILSGIYLVLINGILHLVLVPSGQLYSVTTNVYASITLIVTTFSSIKFGFCLGNNNEQKRNRLKIKPILRINKNSESYEIVSSKNDWFFLGTYNDKNEFMIKFWDSKKLGYKFAPEAFDCSNQCFVKESQQIIVDFKPEPLYIMIKDSADNIYLISTANNNYYFVPKKYWKQLPDKIRLNEEES